MTNYERFREDIEKYTRFGIEVAVGKDTNRVVPCSSISCGLCLFSVGCVDKKLRWADEEYIETEVDWSKVPVDTKIYVKNSEHTNWYPRYFAKCKNGFVWAWNNGATSFSAGGSATEWEYAKLAEKNDE